MIKEGTVIYMNGNSEAGEKAEKVKFVVVKTYPIPRAKGIEDYFALCRCVFGGYPRCFSKLELANNGYDSGLPSWR